MKKKKPLHPTYRHLVVFGDSYSDTGFDNGHGFRRYSNGRVWPEYLAEKMQVATLDVRAWGGALSGRGNYNSNAKDWSGLLWQVEQYKPDTKLTDTLFFIEIGTNDLHDPDLKTPTAQVVANILKAIKKLSSLGAKQIIVWNVNSTLMAPGYSDEQYECYSYYKSKGELAKRLYLEFNHYLEEALHHVNSDQDEVRVELFDANAALVDISTQFENTTTPWLDSRFYPVKHGWLWFDHWHFMTETHSYLAEYIYDNI